MLLEALTDRNPMILVGTSIIPSVVVGGSHVIKPAVEDIVTVAHTLNPSLIGPIEQTHRYTEVTVVVITTYSDIKTILSSKKVVPPRPTTHYQSTNTDYKRATNRDSSNQVARTNQQILPDLLIVIGIGIDPVQV